MSFARYQIAIWISDAFAQVFLHLACYDQPVPVELLEP
jgi:hypothetical protein